jgi:hypothetical protein
LREYYNDTPPGVQWIAAMFESRRRGEARILLQFANRNALCGKCAAPEVALLRFAHEEANPDSLEIDE